MESHDQLRKASVMSNQLSMPSMMRNPSDSLRRKKTLRFKEQTRILEALEEENDFNKTFQDTGTPQMKSSRDSSPLESGRLPRIKINNNKKPNKLQSSNNIGISNQARFSQQIDSFVFKEIQSEKKIYFAKPITSPKKLKYTAQLLQKNMQGCSSEPNIFETYKQPKKKPQDLIRVSNEGNACRRDLLGDQTDFKDRVVKKKQQQMEKAKSTRSLMPLKSSTMRLPTKLKSIAMDNAATQFTNVFDKVLQSQPKKILIRDWAELSNEKLKRLIKTIKMRSEHSKFVEELINEDLPLRDYLKETQSQRVLSQFNTQLEKWESKKNYLAQQAGRQDISAALLQSVEDWRKKIEEQAVLDRAKGAVPLLSETQWRSSLRDYLPSNYGCQAINIGAPGSEKRLKYEKEMAEKKQNETMQRQDRSDYVFIDCFKSDPNVGALYKNKDNNPITLVRKPVFPPAPYELENLYHQADISDKDLTLQIEDLGSSIPHDSSLVKSAEDQHITLDENSFTYLNTTIGNSKMQREGLEKYRETILSFKHTQNDIVAPADEEDLAHLCIGGFSKFKAEKVAAKCIKGKKIIWNTKKLQEELEAQSKDQVLAMHYERRTKATL